MKAENGASGACARADAEMHDFMKGIDMYTSQSSFEHNTPESDRLFPVVGRAAFGGVLAEAVDFICREQLMRPELWHEFVSQFTFCPDDENNGWRCEYWGKMMRGAAFVYAYTRDEALYRVLEDSVREMLATEDSLGRISTYSPAAEFAGWDMWGRKYVLLGMQYFCEVCPDAGLCELLVASMRRQADYIVERIGEGKLAIDKTSNFWLGLNAMSILEPFVRLYNITNEKKYLDFASYIVNVGMHGEACVFRLAAEDRLLPHEYPATKAYEMMSCFEGLAEYYRVVGGDVYRTVLLNFGRRVLSSEVSVIGCAGCTHELFDHTAFSQTDDTRTGIMQETCVSVTLMKLCGQLLRISGDPGYADCIERTFFNAYLGSFNTHCRPSRLEARGRWPQTERVLPFDSYTPLRPGVRGAKIGGLMRMENGAFYGCCACIASAGAGIFPRVNLLCGARGVYINFYLPGDVTAELPEGRFSYTIEGDYPYGGRVTLRVDEAPESGVQLFLRIPAWSRSTVVTVDGERQSAESGYFRVCRRAECGDVLTIDFDMTTYAVFPVAGAPGEDKYMAFRRGAIVLAADARLGESPETPISPEMAASPETPISPEMAASPETLIPQEMPASPETLISREMAASPETLIPQEMPASPEIAASQAAFREVASVSCCGEELPVSAGLCPIPPEIPDSRLCVGVACADGTVRRLIDCASAGKTYDADSAMAVWLPRA